MAITHPSLPSSSVIIILTLPMQSKIKPFVSYYRMWQKDFSAIVNLYFAKIIAVSSKSMMNIQRKPLLEFLPSMAVKMKKKYAKVLEVSRISKEISFNTAIPLRLSLISSARKLKVNVKCNRKF